MMLPAGADIRYKYTLGDGFWNAEHNTDGNFILRQLIVPASSTPVQVQDTVQTWQAGRFISHPFRGKRSGQHSCH